MLWKGFTHSRRSALFLLNTPFGKVSSSLLLKNLQTNNNIALTVKICVTLSKLCIELRVTVLVSQRVMYTFARAQNPTLDFVNGSRSVTKSVSNIS